MNTPLPKLDLFKDRLSWAMTQKQMSVHELSSKAELHGVDIHYWLDDGEISPSYQGHKPKLGEYLALSYILNYPVEWLSDGKVNIVPAGWGELEITGLLPAYLGLNQLVMYRDQTDTQHHGVTKEFSGVEGGVLVTIDDLHGGGQVSVMLGSVYPYTL